MRRPNAAGPLVHAASGPSQHVASLDGVRGLAIALVLLIHVQQTGAIPSRFHAVNTLMHAGWCGVDLFFVLSGFLITLGLLDSTGSDNYFSGFYIRRVLRIFPLYYAVIFLAIVANVILGNYSPHTTLVGDEANGSIFPSPLGWLSHVLYLQNWWMPWQEPASRNVLGHFWSLAIEEQFYLVWPLCVLLVPRRRLFFSAIAVCGAVLLLRILLANHGVPSELIFRNTLTRMDTLMLGAICAIAVREEGLLPALRRWLPLGACAGALYLIAAGFVRSATLQEYLAVTFGFTALALVFGTLTLAAYLRGGTRNWSDRILSMPPLARLGKYSYGVYVYHVIVAYVAKILFASSVWFGIELLPGLAFCGGIVVVSIGIAWLSYEYFEKRFLRLKRLFVAHVPSSAQRSSATPARSEETPIGDAKLATSVSA